MPESTIVVTGASRGIGAEIALSLARAGFQVACLSRSGQAPELADVPDALRARWHAVACDVGDVAQIQRAFAEVSQRAGAASPAW